MFEPHNIYTMNETDVRELIARPFISAMGFRQGTEANIRTEVPLVYDAAFLGRKKRTDPPLRGRADYICELVSYGRWVLEVKGPGQPLGLEEAQQAHTYAAHVSVAALYYVLTNGREFRLYRTSHPNEPAFSWAAADTEQHVVLLRNYLSPDALRKHCALAPLDVSKPLGTGVPSKVKLVGGVVKYQSHSINHPLLQMMMDQKGAQNAFITSGNAARTTEGLIEARFDVSLGSDSMQKFNVDAGIIDHTFRTADEYVSVDADRPTIFQAFYRGTVGEGTTLPIDVFNPHSDNKLLVDIKYVALSEAYGFVADECFQGIFRVETEFQLPPNLPPMAQQFGIPSLLVHIVTGTFKVNAYPA